MLVDIGRAALEQLSCRVRCRPAEFVIRVRFSGISVLSSPEPAALPSDATTIMLNTSNWGPDVGLLAVTSESVWSASGVFRINPTDNSVAGPLTEGASQDIAADDAGVWATDYAADRVRRFDPTTGKQIAVIQLPTGSAPEGVAVTPSAVWVAAHHGGSLFRIDPATNAIVAQVVVGPMGDSGPQGIAVGFGSVWVDVPNLNAVVRVDPTTNTVAGTVTFPSAMSPCGGIAIGTTVVWVTSCLDGFDIARLDPMTNTVAAIIDTGGGIIQPAPSGDTVWFVTGGDPDNSPTQQGLLIHLLANGSVATRIALGAGFVSGGAVVAFGSIWVSSFSKPEVIRIPNPPS